MAGIENTSTEAGVEPRFAADSELADQRRANAGSKRCAATLDELEGQFAAICAQFQALVASVGSELCERAPVAGSWSVAECLQHLSLSADAYFPIWQQVIATAGPRKVEMNAPYRMDFWGRLLCWILEPPARVRSRTPAPFVPIDCGDVRQALDGFLERQGRMMAALRRCRGRAVDEVKMASPIDARVRYSVWSSFVVNAAHQRRHLWQAEQAIAKLRGAS